MDTSARQEPGLRDPVLAVAVAASATAGVIHFAAISEHWATYRAAGIFFLALGAFQVVWAALVAGRPGRGLYAAGAAASLVTIAVWAVSRTSGLPFGPFAGIPERVGRADVISTILEELLVLAIVVLAFAPAGSRGLTRSAYRGAVALIGAAAVPLTVWALAAVHGAGTHGLPGGVPATAGPLAHLVGHHGLHLVFAGGAVVLYFCYLVAHIRRNGWPSFSWRLAPEAEATRIPHPPILTTSTVAGEPPVSPVSGNRRQPYAVRATPIARG